MKKPFTLAGAAGGLLYTGLGMAATYRHAPELASPARLALEFCVLAAFTVPLGGAIGLGAGLVFDGLARQAGRTWALARKQLNPKLPAQALPKRP